MDEYIDREAVLHAILGEPTESHYPSWYAERIKALHAADVVPVVHGRWERDEDGDWYCTNCYEVVAICESGRERTYRKPYCPNCGARMDGGADNG